MVAGLTRAARQAKVPTQRRLLTPLDRALYTRQIPYG